MHFNIFFQSGCSRLTMNHTTYFGASLEGRTIAASAAEKGITPPSGERAARARATFDGDAIVLKILMEHSTENCRLMPIIYAVLRRTLQCHTAASEVMLSADSVACFVFSSFSLLRSALGNRYRMTKIKKKNWRKIQCVKVASRYGENSVSTALLVIWVASCVHRLMLGLM